MLSWRKALITGGVLGAAGLAFVSSERSVSRDEGDKRITVTYWEKWNGDEGAAMQSIVNAFNASQDRIRVKYLSISNIADKTLLATSGGTPPDVSGMWAGQVVQFADANALTDLTELAKENGVRQSDYIPGYWDMLTYKDRLYALPSTPGSSVLHINRDLMPPEYKDEKNFPKTLEEMDALVDKISKKTADGRVALAGFLPSQGFGGSSWIFLFGGGYLKDGQLALNSPENVRAYTWVASYGKKFGNREMQAFQSGFGDIASPLHPFMSSKVAIYSEGPWMSNFIRLYNPKIDWYAAPMPPPADLPNKAGTTVLALNALMIPKGAKHPKEAFEFIRFVQKQEQMEKLCRLQRCNTPLSRHSPDFFTTHPNKYVWLFDKVARSPNAVSSLKLGIAAQISKEMDNATQVVNLGQKTPQEALDEAQSRMLSTWAKYQKQVLAQP